MKLKEAHAYAEEPRSSLYGFFTEVKKSVVTTLPIALLYPLSNRATRLVAELSTDSINGSLVVHSCGSHGKTAQATVPVNRVCLVPATHRSDAKAVSDHETRSVAHALVEPTESKATASLKMVITRTERHAVTCQFTFPSEEWLSGDRITRVASKTDRPAKVGRVSATAKLQTAGSDCALIVLHVAMH